MLLHHPAALLLLTTRLPQPPTKITMCGPQHQLVLAEGDGWLVANKPAGISVHDGESSLINALRSAGHPDMHPCHRLDAETSGVMLLSTRERAREASESLAEATKVYRGVVKGQLRKKRGRWTQSLSPKAEGRRNPRGIAASRVDAITEYATVADNGHLSLVDFTLRTGRTHQIRKHAACQGHPLVGDTRYGDPKHAKQMWQRYEGFGGMALHAALLTLRIDSEKRTFEAPPPESWEPLLRTFGERANAAPIAPPPSRAVATEVSAAEEYGVTPSNPDMHRTGATPPRNAATAGSAAGSAVAGAAGTTAQTQEKHRAKASARPEGGDARPAKAMPPGAYPPKKKNQPEQAAA